MPSDSNQSILFYRTMIYTKRLILLINFCFVILQSWGQVAVKDSFKYAPFQVPSFGRIERIDSFVSMYVDARNIDIWLPENYNDSTRYPVIYMHDGQMLFDTAHTWNHKEWRVDETMHDLIAARKVPPAIVVGVWNSGKMRHSDYFPEKPFNYLPQTTQDSVYKALRHTGQNYFFGKVQSDNYLKFLTTELKPFIDSTFRTKPDSMNTAIMGSSMGGLISIYALCEYPHIFGRAGCLSTHWIGVGPKEKFPIPEAFQKYLKKHLPKSKYHRIYFDYGMVGLDSHYKTHQVLVNRIMKSKGYSKKNWLTKEFKHDDHTEVAWSKRLHIPLSFLFMHYKY